MLWRRTHLLNFPLALNKEPLNHTFLGEGKTSFEMRKLEIREKKELISCIFMFPALPDTMHQTNI